MRASTFRILIVLGLVSAALPVERAQAQGDSTAQKAPTRRPQRGDRNRLTKDDIAQAGSGATALDIIRRLRPQWLQPPVGRIASSNADGMGGGSQQIVLYVDDMRQPDLETGLREVPLAKLVEIRYLDQNRAIQMRGPGHEAGVIEVTTTDKKK